ncbi:MAG: polysaccharide biosynthesis protein [Anaerolineales bacterium]|nr:polysaccharide biosynthesis protein [Anaerolineales bacterium]
MKDQFYLRNRYIFAIDLILIAFSVPLSFLLRLEVYQVFVDYLFTMLVMLGIALLVKPFIFRRFGLYQRFWVYASVRELATILLAVTTASVIVGGIMLLLWALDAFTFFARSVLVIEWLVSLLMVGGVRFLPRFLSEELLTRRNLDREGQVLVVGAGDAGALVVRELYKNPQLRLTPVAFLDDDLEKQGVRIHGVPVVGSLDELDEKLDQLPISEVIIAIPSAPGQVVRQVAEVCRQKEIAFRTMPGIYELIGGIVSVNRLREVEISDLLRREHAHIDPARVRDLLKGKRVLVTGAGGSIASELCRQVARWSPASIVLLGHGENSIFEIMVELEENFSKMEKVPVIVDVRDRQRLTQIFARYQPEVIFHAAAHKHVSLMEKNAEEAVTNNIIGTKNVVEVAAENGVERLVMISTDKAVRPTSIMGATKRMAEMVVLTAAQQHQRQYSVVRFGNVLGSRGSVVPLFKRQIEVGGPVTVRDPEVERYFMTIPEAVHLVLQAFAMGTGGEIFLLNMGEPVKILDLAKDLIRLSGLEPGRDIEIVFTGLRPGEKMSEVLWDDGVDHFPTDHPEITRLEKIELLAPDELEKVIQQLAGCAVEGDADALVNILDEVVPGARIKETPAPDLTALI